MLFAPVQIQPKSFGSRWNFFFFFFYQWWKCLFYKMWLLGCHVASTVLSGYPNLSEGADINSVSGQMHWDKECPFSGVTSCGRVWRMVLESDAQSLSLSHWNSKQNMHSVPNTSNSHSQTQSRTQVDSICTGLCNQSVKGDHWPLDTTGLLNLTLSLIDIVSVYSVLLLETVKAEQWPTGTAYWQWSSRGPTVKMRWSKQSTGPQTVHW